MSGRTKRGPPSGKETTELARPACSSRKLRQGKPNKEKEKVTLNTLVQRIMRAIKQATEFHLTFHFFAHNHNPSDFEVVSYFETSKSGMKPLLKIMHFIC